ncbi:uncharacterized protein LOC123308104 isoform X2 [Coccinella septempunctata]|uniref:uncharacterized protein LOC123308104 isoform X2 n=1 Tax=Coccinella septempunctata TaxID=41139 RepID=UPI001D096B4F|nr:uncharacterized protein LOC123308104 isoform X2 [Coccinella septempunctata]
MGQHYRCRLLYHLLSRCLLGLPHPYRLYHHLGQSPIRSKCCTLSQCHLAEYCDLELSHLLMLVARSGIPGYNEGIAEYIPESERGKRLRMNYAVSAIERTFSYNPNLSEKFIKKNPQI